MAPRTGLYPPSPPSSSSPTRLLPWMDGSFDLLNFYSSPLSLLLLFLINFNVHSKNRKEIWFWFWEEEIKKERNGGKMEGNYREKRWEGKEAEEMIQPCGWQPDLETGWSPPSEILRRKRADPSGDRRVLQNDVVIPRESLGLSLSLSHKGLHTRAQRERERVYIPGHKSGYTHNRNLSCFTTSP